MNKVAKLEKTNVVPGTIVAPLNSQNMRVTVQALMK